MSKKKDEFVVQTRRGMGVKASPEIFARLKENKDKQKKVCKRALRAFDGTKVGRRIYGMDGNKLFYRLKGISLVKVTKGAKVLTITAGKGNRLQLPIAAI